MSSCPRAGSGDSTHRCPDPLLFPRTNFTLDSFRGIAYHDAAETAVPVVAFFEKRVVPPDNENQAASRSHRRKWMSQYTKLGIDPSKEGVRNAFQGIISNDFPGAFVNIVRDPFHPGEVITQHNDGDGSKFLQRLLLYLVTNDIRVFDGMVDDAVSMNMGDIAASGFTTGPISVTDTLHVNGFNIPKAVVMDRIQARLSQVLDLYREHGFHMTCFGGETADLPDQVQTATFDVCVHAVAQERDVVKGNVVVGDWIWGLSSGGQALWEQKPNSGIMSNGVTLARYCTTWEGYGELYPFLLKQGGSFQGKLKVGEGESLLRGKSLAHALISPTRHWAIAIKILIDDLRKHDSLHLLHGISMNTGGGASKIKNVGSGILYRKQMPTPLPIFHAIQKASGEAWENMFQTFNGGVGIDIVGHKDLQPFIERLSEKSRIDYYLFGECDAFSGGGNLVELVTEYGTFRY